MRGNILAVILATIFIGLGVFSFINAIRQTKEYHLPKATSPICFDKDGAQKPCKFVELDEKMTWVGQGRGADVYFIKSHGHECFMASVGNGVSIHCPK